MKNRILIIVILFFVSLQSIEANTGTVFRIRNYWKNAYLNVETGNLECSKIQSEWLTAMWIIQPVIGTKYYRIRDVKTGSFLNIENGLKASDIIDTWESAMWTFDSIPGSNMCRIRNRMNQTYLNTENNLKSTSINSGWHSAMWFIEVSEITPEIHQSQKIRHSPEIEMARQKEQQRLQETYQKAITQQAAQQQQNTPNGIQIMQYYQGKNQQIPQYFYQAQTETTSNNSSRGAGGSTISENQALKNANAAKQVAQTKANNSGKTETVRFTSQDGYGIAVANPNGPSNFYQQQVQSNGITSAAGGSSISKDAAFKNGQLALAEAQNKANQTGIRQTVAIEFPDGYGAGSAIPNYVPQKQTQTQQPQTTQQVKQPTTAQQQPNQQQQYHNQQQVQPQPVQVQQAIQQATQPLPQQTVQNFQNIINATQNQFQNHPH